VLLSILRIALLALVVGIASPSTASDTVWRPLRVGAGGWLTGIDISPDGSTRVVRSDTYGAYIWDDKAKAWSQLVTAASMPKPHLNRDYAHGVFEIRVAPSTPSRLYMAFAGTVYRSDNRGGTWMATAFKPVVMEPNDRYRMLGQKLAIDPANPDVVYAGTQANGLFVTRDGGASWKPVGAVPLSKKGADDLLPGISGIAFDVTSGALSGRTKTIYAASFGNGVFRSQDAGATWARLPGGPDGVGHAKISADGGYYVNSADQATIWRFADGRWTNITPEAQEWDTVLVDPHNADRVIAIRAGGYLDISQDRGVTWSGVLWGPGHNIRVAADIPWLAWTKEEFMATGDMMFDPVLPGRIWFAEGIGVWYTDLPADGAKPEAVTFTSVSTGIEQLVATQVLAPPGGKPLVAAWDRPVFYLEDAEAFPATHGPDNEINIIGGWALDYASSKPEYVAGIFDWWGQEKSGFSTDGGRTWTPFASHPELERSIGGTLAVSTPKNIVWVASSNQSAYVTQDGGAHWHKIALPGVPEVGETGWSFAYYLNRHIVAADRVAANRFYLYNYLKGLYLSKDGGKSWSLVHKGEIVPFSGYNASLRSVPGHEGELFFTTGRQSGTEPVATPFVRSTDGGATWKAVPNVLEVITFGFGKPKRAGGYPAIYIVGWVGRAYGIWRSDDNASSWTRIGEFPLGSLDEIKTIDGDKTEYGRVYVGFQGSGFAYGALK
jgi:photosystem II stability/assembly factor-like uncharacterized protein